jgi:hypothetical protein
MLNGDICVHPEAGEGVVTDRPIEETLKNILNKIDRS